MEVITAKTVRFSELVKQCGAPHVVTLWGDPKHDPELQKTVRENRVMTVQQTHTGSKADFGLVGFHSEKNATYLVFPKSLAGYSDRRVVGIKYDLIETPPVTDAAKIKPPPVTKRRTAATPPIANTKVAEATKAKPKPAPPPPPEPQFQVEVERVSTETINLAVTARNQTEARKEALRLAEKESQDGKAKVTYRVKKVVRSE